MKLILLFFIERTWDLKQKGIGFLLEFLAWEIIIYKETIVLIFVNIITTFQPQISLDMVRIWE